MSVRNGQRKSFVQSVGMRYIDYCHSLDKTESFVGLSKPKVLVFATYAVTFMLRGIETPYKQSVGYCYTNGLKSFELVEIVKLVIGKVLNTGNYKKYS